MKNEPQLELSHTMPRTEIGRELWEIRDAHEECVCIFCLSREMGISFLT